MNKNLFNELLASVREFDKVSKIPLNDILPIESKNELELAALYGPVYSSIQIVDSNHLNDYKRDLANGIIEANATLDISTKIYL